MKSGGRLARRWSPDEAAAIAQSPMRLIKAHRSPARHRAAIGNSSTTLRRRPSLAAQMGSTRHAPAAAPPASTGAVAGRHPATPAARRTS
jgi:hypothetical protein